MNKNLTESMAAGDEAWTVTLTTLKANGKSRAMRVASGDQAVDQCSTFCI